MKLLKISSFCAGICFLLFWITLNHSPLFGGFNSKKQNNPLQNKNQTVHQLYEQAVAAIEDEAYSKAEQYLRRVLDRNSLFQEPSGKSAWYLLGVALQKQDEMAQATETLQKGLDTLRQAGKNDWYLNYDLARLYSRHPYQAQENDSLITQLLYKTLRHISPAKQPDLLKKIFDQYAFLFNKAQKEKFKKSLEKPNSYPGMILLTIFYQEDPNPISPSNTSIPVLFRRRAKAKEQYSDRSSPSGLDDRGKMYVRLGEPENIFRDPSGVLGVVGHAINPYEIWFYTQIHQDVYYTFILKSGSSGYALVNGPEAILGTFFRQRRTMFNRSDPGETITLLRFNLYMKLSPLHPDFRNRLYRLREQASYSEAADYAKMHFVKEDQEHAAHMDTLVPNIAIYTDKYNKVPFELNVASFKDKKGASRLEVYYSIANDDLFYKRKNNRFYAHLAGEVGLFDEQYQLSVRDSLRHNLVLPNFEATKEDVFVGQWNAILDPDRYRLFLRLENTFGKGLAIERSDLMVPPFSSDKLMLSSIQFATTIRKAENDPDNFVKHGWFVSPLVANEIHHSRTLHIYYEIYNLKPNASGQTNYAIEYRFRLPKKKKGFFKSIFDVFGDSDKNQYKIIREQETGKSGMQIKHKQFDMQPFRPGDIQFELIVNDLNANKQTKKKSTFRILE